MTASDNTQELKNSENLGLLTANVLEAEFLTDENDSNEATESSLETFSEAINRGNLEILEAAFVSEILINESATSPQSSPIEAPSQVAGALASVERDLSNVCNHATNFAENANGEHLSTGVQPSTSTSQPQSQLSITTDGTGSAAFKRKKHIMISYNRESSYDICRRICDELRRRGFEVWIDEDNLHESILLQALANAVENSYVVLLCFNSAYAASEYCRKEACYAIEKRIPYIPCRMEAGFDPTGWLGITITDHVYCDFSSLNDFNKALEKLIRQIKNFEAQLQSDSGSNNSILSSVATPSSVSSTLVENQNFQVALQTIVREFKRRVDQTYNDSEPITDAEVPELVRFVREQILHNNPSSSTIDNSSSQEQRINDQLTLRELLHHPRNQTELLKKIVEILSTMTEPRTIIKLSLAFMFIWTIRGYFKHR
ncbi:unnamed protein product [Rotaria socialis]|uniref:TIR domain-containing protein n=1 Tax=Rotaria socialis TaxID=392032 RepID=A0A818Q4W1_9BILA|nr:unnamed protein product [Rotaria socialis]CAF4729387.1 unnamed protein product [Rotaria socialis]